MSNKKQIAYAKEGRSKLKSGIDKLAKVVVTTLGPRGRNVAIDRPWGTVDVIHDGISVAKEVFLEDPFENMGAQLVKQAADKTNTQAGDGTTTATLIAQQIVEKGMEEIDKDANPMFMKKGIDLAVKEVIKELKRIAKPVKKDEWEKVATISAQNKEIGVKIAEALNIVGQTGLVEVGENNTSKIEVEHVDGMELDSGYFHQYFATNPEKEAVMERPFILIADARISSAEALIPIIKKAQGAGRPLLIIADNIDGQALNLLLVNKLRGGMEICAVRAPSFGDKRESVLEDIAILTGGSVVAANTGISLETAELEHCGIAERVVVGENFTRITGGEGDKEAIKDRITALTKLADKSDVEFDQTKIEERIAKLSEGVAIVKVGAATEVELNELRERVKDAIGATKAAIEEGIVPGGGIALYRSSSVLDNLKAESSDEQIGIDIVRNALKEPVRWLAKNSGVDPQEVINKMENSTDQQYGLNAATLKYGNMMEMGIVDPVKVTRLVLENGASAASMALTTEALITELDVNEKNEISSN